MKKTFSEQELTRMLRCAKAKSRFLLHAQDSIPFTTFTQEQLKIVKKYYEYGYFSGYRRALKDGRGGK